MRKEILSIFDIFKIGVGPSSSHTLGPWRAAENFIQNLSNLHQVKTIQIYLYGSLAKTGIGHGTDLAVQMGLLGQDPVTCDTSKLNDYILEIKNKSEIKLGGLQTISFNPTENIHFLKRESLPYHPNALKFTATYQNEEIFSEIYYSVGGGFIEKEGEKVSTQKSIILKYDYADSDELLQMCMTSGLSLADLTLENEACFSSEIVYKEKLKHIADTMFRCIYKGCYLEGILPGGLNVSRRAGKLNKHLLKNTETLSYETWLQTIRSSPNNFNTTLNWVSCFALAVNEENASFGRVVTAPTNGAAGVIPAVLMYHQLFCNDDENMISVFISTAATIGMLFKRGATISAAMGGCQAEIGVSSAMAAAGLTACMGGTVSQVMQASEIAMEHHLGLTCDPIGGLVQIPCIERNTMGAIKAITAAQLAMQSNPEFAKVSLDNVIKTMWETALDMNSKYKETSDGGLAINIPVGLPEC